MTTLNFNSFSWFHFLDFLKAYCFWEFMEESALVVVVWVAGECAYPHTHTYGYIYAAVVRLPPASTTGTTIADFLNSWGERAEKKETTGSGELDNKNRIKSRKNFQVVPIIIIFSLYLLSVIFLVECIRIKQLWPSYVKGCLSIFQK